MKRTCSGCAAHSREHCQLGHAIIASGALPYVIRYAPAENCEKPLTIKALMRILEAREKRAEEVKGKKGLVQ